MKKKLFSIILLVLAALVLALAPAAQADAIVQTSSADLNLTGRVVLAAVNFYDPTPGDRNHPTVGSIQGVDFDDFNIVVDDRYLCHSYFLLYLCVQAFCRATVKVVPLSISVVTDIFSPRLRATLLTIARPRPVESLLALAPSLAR